MKIKESSPRTEIPRKCSTSDDCRKIFKQAATSEQKNPESLKQECEFEF